MQLSSAWGKTYLSMKIVIIGLVIDLPSIWWEATISTIFVVIHKILATSKAKFYLKNAL